MGFFGFISIVGISDSKDSSSSSFPVSTSAQDSTTGSMSTWLHFSVQVEIESVILEIDWSEIVLFVPVHQFLKINSHSRTNFAVNRDHVNTIVSQIEILLSFARDLCSTAQHFVYIRESFIQ